jgi:hypothetical protein
MAIGAIEKLKETIGTGSCCYGNMVRNLSRDIFSSYMNLEYIKNEHTLFSKFSTGSKNEFRNIGKTIEKFKKDLKIDLKKKGIVSFQPLILPRSKILDPD